MKARLMRSSLFRGASISFLLRLVDMAIGYGSTIVLARFLGLSEFGQYSLLISLVMVLTIPTSFGIPTMMVRETGKAFAAGHLNIVPALKHWAYTRIISISVPLLAIAVVIIWLGEGIFVGDDQLAATLSLLLVVLIPLSGVRGSILRGLDRIFASQLSIRLVRPACVLGIVGSLLALSILDRPSLPPTAATAMAANVFGAIASWIFGSILLRRALRGFSQETGQERIKISGWGSSLFAFGLADAMYVIDGQLGLLILGALASDAEVGLYRIAVQAATVVAMGYAATNVALTPKIARHWALGDIEAIRRLVRRGSQLAFVFALPVALAIVIFGRSVIEIALGAEFGPAIGPATILVAGQLVNCAFGSAGALLNMSSHEKLNTISYGSGIVANIALALVLIPAMGATGAALAAALSMVLRNLLLFYFALSKFGVNTAFWAR